VGEITHVAQIDRVLREEFDAAADLEERNFNVDLFLP